MIRHLLANNIKNVTQSFYIWNTCHASLFILSCRLSLVGTKSCGSLVISETINPLCSHSVFSSVPAAESCPMAHGISVACVDCAGGDNGSGGPGSLHCVPHADSLR